MNPAVRRLGGVMAVLMLLLVARTTWVQVVAAPGLRSDPRNERAQIAEYSHERGRIQAEGELLARSVPTDDPLRFRRRYPGGRAFTPVTGHLSPLYGSRGLERAMDAVLEGSSDRLLLPHLATVLSGGDPAGGDVALTIDPELQRVAYEQMTRRGYEGAVVAIRPDTGAIMAMVSTPTYDPGPLASHRVPTQRDAWRSLRDADPPRLPDRAIDRTYPPGSTFKLVSTAAALEAGQIDPDTPVTAAPRITLPDSTTTLENYDGDRCGPAATVSFETAFAKSCNAPFARLAVRLGARRLRAQAEALGFGARALSIPTPVADSRLGDLRGDAARAQSGIGQRDVRLTPLENAHITATIANGGVPVRPHLVAAVTAADGTVLDTRRPQVLDRAFSRATADTLTRLMVTAERHSAPGGTEPGATIASKTGTAEWGPHPKTTPPHTWYDAFGPVGSPRIAVSVLVEHGGDRGTAGTGSSVAAPIGRAVIDAALAEGR